MPFSTTRSNAKRRIKTTTLKRWARDWKNTPKTGRFAIANRIPPSLKPTKHFSNLKDNRETFGRLVQCRTGHAYTGEFRRTFIPLAPEPTTCPCDNETPETREHIIRDCPRYNQQREVLKKASTDITLPEILGTPKGIKALTEFLQKSGAFTRTGTPPTEPLPPTINNEPIPDLNQEINPIMIEDDGG